MISKALIDAMDLKKHQIKKLLLFMGLRLVFESKSTSRWSLTSRWVLFIIHKKKKRVLFMIKYYAMSDMDGYNIILHRPLFFFR